MFNDSVGLLRSPEMINIVKNVFAAKRVPIDLLPKIADYREYHGLDFEAVKATIKSGIKIQPFDFYFDFVVSEVAKLKALWDK